MASQVSERQAREVAEKAREQEWELPSFGRELFLGSFRLDLIHPQPRQDSEAVETGRALSRRAATLSGERGRSARHRAGGQGARRGDRGPQGARSPGDEGAGGLRRARALPGLLQPGARARGRLPLRRCPRFSRPTSRSAWRSRCACSARGAEARVAAPRVAHATCRRSCYRARRGLRSRSAWRRPPPHRGRLGLRAERPQAVGHERRDRRRGGGHGQGPRGRRPRRGNNRLHPPLRQRGDQRRAPQRVHGPARDRELGDAPRGRLLAQRERDRNGGRGPQGRPRHPEHRPARASRHLRRRRKVVHEGRPRVRQRARAVGAARGQARGRGPQGGLHRRERVRPGGHARHREPAGRRQEGRHPRGGRAGQALRLRARLAGGGRARAGPGRPRLRDGAIAQGSWGASGAGGAGAARHADQPHLRGIHRDHASAHRPRGGGPAPPGRRRRSRFRRRPAGEGEVRARPREPSTRSGFPSSRSARASVRAHTTTSASWESTCASSSAARASSPARPSTPSARWEAKLEKKQAFLGRIVDIGAELFAMASAVVYADTLASEQSGARRRGARARRPVLRAGPPPGRRAVRRPVVERRRRELRGRGAGARGPLHLGRGGHRRPVGRRPVVRQRKRASRSAPARPPGSPGRSSAGSRHRPATRRSWCATSRASPPGWRRGRGRGSGRP